MYIETDCMSYFGTRLRDLRKKSGLSQDTLAKELGISKGALCYYENGERTPDIVILEKVAIYFNVTFDYLMGYSKSMDPKYASVVDFTCFSEEAATVLMNELYDEGGETLSKLVENKKFVEAIQLIECEAHADLSHCWSGLHYSTNDTSYSAFVLEKILMEAISETIEDRSAEISSAIVNSKLKPEEREQYLNWILAPYDNINDRKNKSYENKEKQIQVHIEQWQKEEKIRRQALENLKSFRTKKESD